MLENCHLTPFSSPALQPVPYIRDDHLATAAVRCSDLRLQAAAPAWSERFEPESPRLVVPLSDAFECRLGPRAFACDPLRAAWLRPDRPYRMRRPHAGRRSLLIAWPDAPARAAGPIRTTLHDQFALQRWVAAARTGDHEPLALEDAMMAILARLLEPAAMPPSDPPAAVERARAFLAADPAFPGTLADIARAAGASPYHLARLFRRHVGLGLHAFRTELRLALALDALRDGARDLARLAVELGFAHHSHFSAVLARRLHAAPSRLRTILTAPTGHRTGH